MDIAQFRIDFAEFANTTTYPDSMITFWSDLAENQIDPNKFGVIRTPIVELYTAHSITLAAKNVDVAGFGGFPGDIGGATSSKEVGSSSVSYDTGDSMELDAGHWNTTWYGKAYLRLIKLNCAGCVQL